MKAWLLEYYTLEQLGPLPPAIRLEAFSEDPCSAASLREVEFVVPPYRPAEVVEALQRMPRLKVIQTDSAGVEWLVGHVPPGLGLCNARGVHDVATSEWVVAAT